MGGLALVRTKLCVSEASETVPVSGGRCSADDWRELGCGYLIRAMVDAHRKRVRLHENCGMVRADGSLGGVAT